MSPLLLDIISIWGIRHPFSALSHFSGAMVSLVACYLLYRSIRTQGISGLARLSFGVYGFSLLLVFTASGLFHYLPGPYEELRFFNKLDHSAIFVHIAATSGAVYAALRSRWGNILCGAIWTICLGGMVLNLLLWPLGMWASSLIYLTVGWAAVSGTLGMARRLGWAALRPLFMGGGILSLGAIIYALRWPTPWVGVIEGHEVFHALVLLGIGLHFQFIYQYCLTAAAPTNQRDTSLAPAKRHPDRLPVAPHVRRVAPATPHQADAA